jgi:hypothetical protein
MPEVSRMVAEQAGLGKGTVFRRFGDLNDSHHGAALTVIMTVIRSG